MSFSATVRAGSEDRQDGARQLAQNKQAIADMKERIRALRERARPGNQR